MLNWFIKKKEPVTVAEKQLEEIKNLLFPQLSFREGPEGEKYYIDSTIDANISSVITDIEDGYSDQIMAKTLKDVNERLYKVRKILDAFEFLDTDADYVIVDNNEDSEFDPESIIPKE